jgi:hypothetical protein
MTTSSTWRAPSSVFAQSSGAIPEFGVRRTHKTLRRIGVVPQQFCKRDHARKTFGFFAFVKFQEDCEPPTLESLTIQPRLIQADFVWVYDSRLSRHLSRP